MESIVFVVIGKTNNYRFRGFENLESAGNMKTSWYGNNFGITGPFEIGNHQPKGDYHHKGLLMRSFNISFEVSLNKVLNSWVVSGLLLHDTYVTPL